jgi:hypothetical protein
VETVAGEQVGQCGGCDSGTEGGSAAKHAVEHGKALERVRELEARAAKYT